MLPWSGGGRVGERADGHRVHAAAPAGNRRKDRRRLIAYADVDVDVAYMRAVENGVVPVSPPQGKNWGQMVVRCENYVVEARPTTWRSVVIFIALMDYGIYLWQRLSGKSPTLLPGSIFFFLVSLIYLGATRTGMSLLFKRVSYSIA